MHNIYEKTPKMTQQQFESLYEFKEPIDSGSYGMVMKYLDRKSGEFVAIKFLKDQEGLESFENQEEIMNQIDHENVLKCLGFYYNTTKSQFLLITPYCDKINLKTCLSKITSFQEKQKIWLCLQIARGIYALHSKNIMHRDIKPANILITGDWVLKLCDFGFGKVDEDMKQSVKVGTPLYRDPNVNLGTYSKKCDIYSVGLVYDTIFRGQSYFAHTPQNNFPQQLLYFKQNKKKIINKLVCSQEMKDIIIGCLESDETRRYSARLLQSKLEEIWAKVGGGQAGQAGQVKQGSLGVGVGVGGSGSVSGGGSSVGSSVKEAESKKGLDDEYEKMVQKEKNQANQRKFNNKIIQNNTEEINMKQSMYQFPTGQIKFNRMPTEPNKNTNNGNEAEISLFNGGAIHASQYVGGPKFTKRGSQSIMSPIKLKTQNSRSYGQNNNNTKFMAKLLRTREVTLNNVEKNLNFQKIYQYFISRRNKIRQITEIQRLHSIPNRDKKIIIYIALFGYLRFLKINKTFLKQQKPVIKSIQNIPHSSISQKTIQICLDLIQSQTIQVLQKIKPFLSDLNTDLPLYKEVVTPNVANMVDYGAGRKFLNIETYPLAEIVKEFEDIIGNRRYGGMEAEGKLKERLFEIKEAF